MANPKFRAGVIAFQSMDLTDFASPVETLSHARDASGNSHFEVVVIAAAEEIHTSQNVTIRRHTDFATATRNLSDYDVLVVPGGHVGVVEKLLSAEEDTVKLVKAFSGLPPRAGAQSSRVLMSVCSGALFLGYTGVLASRHATTHHTLLKELQKTGQPHGETEVSHSRFVDGGLLKTGTRVITSGGITSGFDAALYLIEILVNRGCADVAAMILDYQWRRSEGVVG